MPMLIDGKVYEYQQVKSVVGNSLKNVLNFGAVGVYFLAQAEDVLDICNIGFHFGLDVSHQHL